MLYLKKKWKVKLVVKVNLSIIRKFVIILTLTALIDVIRGDRK